MNAKKKGKDPKEAIKRTATETLKGGVRSYGIASVGSLLGGMMHNNFFNESFDELERALYAGDADCEADEFIKKAENLKEKAAKRLESAESDCKLAFARFGEKKLRVLSHSVSNFLDHFHRLNRSRITIEGVNMQDIQRQVSDARNILNQSVQDL